MINKFYRNIIKSIFQKYISIKPPIKAFNDHPQIQHNSTVTNLLKYLKEQISKQPYLKRPIKVKWPVNRYTSDISPSRS